MKLKIEVNGPLKLTIKLNDLSHHDHVEIRQDTVSVYYRLRS